MALYLKCKLAPSKIRTFQSTLTKEVSFKEKKPMDSKSIHWVYSEITEEADTFKKYLREMGVKDAWIVSFKDGQRVPIKDVLEGVI